MTELKIRHIQQIDDNHCLSAVCAMALSHFGIIKNQEEIGRKTQKINSSGQTEAVTYDICGYIADQGLCVLYYGNHSDEESWNFLVDNVKKNLPVIVGQRYDFTDNLTGHARLITRISESTNSIMVYYNDPNDKQPSKMSKEQFSKLWQIGNSELKIKNELFVIMQNRPDLIKKCHLCNTNMDSAKNDFLHNPPGLSPKYDEFSISSTGEFHACEQCNYLTHIFF